MCVQLPSQQPNHAQERGGQAWWCHRIPLLGSAHVRRLTATSATTTGPAARVDLEVNFPCDSDHRVAIVCLCVPRPDK